MVLPRFLGFFKNIAGGHSGGDVGGAVSHDALRDKISDAVDSYGMVCAHIGVEKNPRTKNDLCLVLARDVLVNAMEVQELAMQRERYLSDADVLDVIDFLATSGRALEGIAEHFGAQNPLQEGEVFHEIEGLAGEFRRVETDMIEERLGLLLYNTHRRDGVETLIAERQWPEILSIKIRGFRDIPSMYEHDDTRLGR